MPLLHPLRRYLERAARQLLGNVDWVESVPVDGVDCSPPQIVAVGPAHGSWIAQEGLEGKAPTGAARHVFSVPVLHFGAFYPPTPSYPRRGGHNLLYNM